MSSKMLRQSGQCLLELMVAMGVFVMVVSGIMFLVLDSGTANRQGADRTRAALAAQEGIEAVKSIIAQGWRNLSDGEHGVDDSTGSWGWLGSSNIIANRFTRKITVEPVYRDVNGEIVASGVTADFDTKKVTARTSWDFTTARPSEVVLETYLTNWRSTKWLQTTEADYNLGQKNQVVTTSVSDGEVALAQSSTLSLYDFTIDAPADYTYDSNKIEIAASQASLMSQIPLTTGGTVNPGFDATLLPWQYADWDQGGGEVNVTGSRVTSGGNPGAYASINIPRGRDDQVGGYFSQSFVVTAASPETAYLSFDISTIAYSGTPLTLQAYVFVDSTSGAPTIGTEVWQSGVITGTSNWASLGPIDLTSIITATGTYYLKLAVWVQTGGSQAGAFTVGFDNALVHWEQSGTPSYPTDDPTVEPAISFSSTEVYAWNAFIETATKNGGEIYYQLSQDDGASWQYWNGSGWAAAGASNYSTAAEINSHLATFPAAAQRLSFKAFLSSDGTQQVSLDNVRVAYLVSGATGYELTGDFISSARDTGVVETVFNYLAWTADEPSGTSLQFQIRSAGTEAALAAAVWVGPDGTTATYYVIPGTTVTADPAASGTRWLQYRALFTSDGSTTPVLQDVTIDYGT